MSFAAEMAMGETPNQRATRLKPHNAPIEIDGDSDVSYSTAMNKEKLASGGAGKAAGGAAMGGAGGVAAMMALQAYSNYKAGQQKQKEDEYAAHLNTRNNVSKALEGLITTTRSMRL